MNNFIILEKYLLNKNYKKCKKIYFYSVFKFPLDVIYEEKIDSKLRNKVKELSFINR